MSDLLLHLLDASSDGVVLALRHHAPVHTASNRLGNVDVAHLIVVLGVVKRQLVLVHDRVRWPVVVQVPCIVGILASVTRRLRLVIDGGLDSLQLLLVSLLLGDLLLFGLGHGSIIETRACLHGLRTLHAGVHHFRVVGLLEEAVVRKHRDVTGTASLLGRSLTRGTDVSVSHRGTGYLIETLLVHGQLVIDESQITVKSGLGEV